MIIEMNAEITEMMKIAENSLNHLLQTCWRFKENHEQNNNRNRRYERELNGTDSWNIKYLNWKFNGLD